MNKSFFNLFEFRKFKLLIDEIFILKNQFLSIQILNLNRKSWRFQEERT